MKTKLCHCPPNYCSAYGPELGGGGACRMDYDENGPIINKGQDMSILRKNVDQWGIEDGPPPTPESVRKDADYLFGSDDTNKGDKMGMGWDKSGDYWEPSSMLETHPDCRDNSQTSAEFDDSYRMFVEQQRNGVRAMMEDVDSVDRVMRWLQALRSGELTSRPICLDFRTLDWLIENIFSAQCEFPSEIKARLAKEAAAILKEAEDLEARAKKLREKAAKTK